MQSKKIAFYVFNDIYCYIIEYYNETKNKINRK